MAKKVIGFDGSRAFGGKRTGTENYSYQLLKALAKIDKRNRYIIYTRHLSKDDTAGLEFDKWPRNFTFTALKWPRFWTQGGLALQTFKDRVDVLFVPSHTLPVFKKPGLKTVMTVHDLGVEYLPKMHQLKQQIYLKNITRYQFRSATKLIAVSKATKEDLVKRVGINPAKIAVVYEGYDKKLFKPVKNEVLVNTLKQYDLVSGKYFLFVGTVQPRKNLEKVIRAFFLMGPGDSKLVIAGSKGWSSDGIYALPKKLGTADQVKFLGYVPDKDMPAFYSGAAALIFASLFEGFGLPILEAQACGCPVITSKTSSMPEVAGKGAILVDPYSEEAIADAMIKIQVKAVRERLIKMGFENVKKFSWEKCAEETLKILESL